MAKMHHVFAGIVCFFAGTVLATQQGTLGGSVYTIKVPDGATWTLSPEDVEALGTGNKLLLDKTSSAAAGTGRLIIATDLKTAEWDGEIEVLAGYLRVGCAGALGGVGAKTAIRMGGQLEQAVQGNEQWVNGEIFEFEGTGPDGKGALVGLNSGTHQYFLSGDVTTAFVRLTGDATFTFTGNCDFRNHKWFDMGGHDLIVKGSYFSLTATRIVNAGNIRIESNTFGLESVGGISSGTDQAFDASDRTITFDRGDWQTFRFCYTEEFPMKIVTADHLLITHGWGEGSRVISGDVVLGGNLECQFGDTEKYLLEFSGTITANGHAVYSSNHGRVVFSGKVEKPAFGAFFLSKGELTFGEMGDANLTGQASSFIGSTDYAHLPARLNLNGPFVVPTVNNAIRIGRASSNGSADAQRGILQVGTGVVISNSFWVGAGDWNMRKTSGAIFQNGGYLRETSTGLIGYYGDGYYELNDGRLYPNSWFEIGYGGGAGVFVQKGGEVETANYDGFMVADGSYNGVGSQGCVYLSGGRFRHNGAMQICQTIWGRDGAAARGGYGVFTIDGTASYEATGADSYIRMAFMSNSVAILNLNGGTMKTAGAKKVVEGKTEIGGNWPYGEMPYDDNRAYVNFNGGTMQVTSQSAFYYNDGLHGNRPDRVTVYAGGAKFIGTTCEFEIGAALRRPEGMGVISVPFSCNVPWQYVGAPMIRIVDAGGTGYGASAVAEFDSKSGTISGVKVTSPGCNYTNPIAEISYGGWSNKLEVAAVAGTQEKDGGVTVGGNQVVGFRHASDYEGPTRVEGSATIKVYVENGIPEGSALEICGGTIDLNGHPHVATTLSGNGGSVIGDLLIQEALITDYAQRHGDVGAPIVVQGNVNFADGAKVVLNNADLLGDDAPDYVIATATGGFSNIPELVAPGNGNVRLKVTGNALKIGLRRGLAIILR